MNPEDEAVVRQIALSLLTQQPSPAGEGRPPEIVITYRKHEDYENFVRQIAELQDRLKKAEMAAANMSMYAAENLRLYDQLRWAYMAMQKAGLDVSFITSVRPRKQPKKLKDV